MAISVYDKAILPANIQSLIQTIQDKWQAATTPAEKNSLHQQAEQLRAQYGNYSGGDWGNKFIAGAKTAAQTVAQTVTDLVNGGTINPIPAATTIDGNTNTVSNLGQGVSLLDNNTGDAIIPASMTPQFQHVLTIGLAVVALGFVAKMFSGRGGKK